MKAIYSGFLIILFLFFSFTLPGQPFQVQQFQLENGLTVFLNEDFSADKVFGAVMVKAGGKHDPADATGIAHYLEHLLFKGTTEMGTIDFEKEKPHLDSIRALYDRLAKVTTGEQKQAIQLGINEHAVAASRYGLPNEFDRLLKSIGSTGVNAFTNYEMTFYHNSFPPNQVAKWLDIYAHRFQDPVFRSFQSELEVVYEEKNRAMDDLIRRVFENFQQYVFPKQPYGTQSVLGKVEHLKNPSLTKMYEYFRNYYLANNMALILCGNFDSEQVIPIIKEKFGDLRQGEVPTFPDYPKSRFKGKEKVNVRITPIKAGFLGFKTIPLTDPDREALLVCNNLIFNESETGLLNRLQLENKLMFCGASPIIYKDDGATMIFFVPKILIQSLRKGEKLVLNEIGRINRGDFSDALLSAVKARAYRDFQLSTEDLRSRAEAIGWAFTLGISWEDYLNFSDRLQQVTKEDVMRVARKYYGDDFVAMYSRTGFPKKPKLEKPPYRPVVTDQSQQSAYAEKFEQIETLPIEPRFVDLKKDVKRLPLAGNNQLYVTANPVNDIFELNIKYHIGTETNRDLEMAARLMRFAGTENYSLQQLKEKFAALGTSYSFDTDLNYLGIKVMGIENQLVPVLKLVNELLINARPTDNSVDVLVNEIKTERRLEKNSPREMGIAVLNYGVHGQNSRFLERPSLKEVKTMKPEQMLELFQEATNYAASVHYVGNKPAPEIKELIEKHLTLAASGKKTPKVYREGIRRNENTIFFVHDKKAVQSQVYFYLQGEPYDGEKLAVINAFNKYFGDGFNGLVLQEIREYRSLAYSAWGRYFTPDVVSGKKARLLGYIGCQADKTAEAIGVMNALLDSLPRYRDRMPVIREGLQLETATAYPAFRDLSQQVENYQTFGYRQDPNELAYPAYANMNFDDILSFYESAIKDRPVTITIYGDKRKINLDRLNQIGRVVELKRKDVVVK